MFFSREEIIDDTINNSHAKFGPVYVSKFGSDGKKGFKFLKKNDPVTLHRWIKNDATGQMEMTEEVEYEAKSLDDALRHINRDRVITKDEIPITDNDDDVPF